MTTQLVDGLVVEIDGEAGHQRPAVLCIHGLGGSSNTWAPVMDALRSFQVIRPDLPGSARSELGDQTLSIEVYVAALARLLDRLEVESVHIVAHSLGTIVAQHFAVRHAAKVQSLALFGPLVAPPEAARPNIVARAQLARTGAAGMQQIADAIVAGATSVQTKQQSPLALALVRECVMRQAPEGYAQSCEALATAQSAQIERIAVPTLLVTGDQDGVAPPANVAAMAERIKGSRQVVFDGCGHWTTFENPRGCMQELKRFHDTLR
jgi:3-oxoadipate enol-lactonase